MRAWVCHSYVSENAFAFVLVVVTAVGGIAYEIVRRREVRRAEARVRAAIQAEEAVMIVPAAAP